MPTNQSIDQKEIKKFEQMAAEWWDSQGKFKPLHHMNPCRLDYIIKQIEIEFRALVSELLASGIEPSEIMDDPRWNSINERATAVGFETWPVFLELTSMG